MFKLKIVDYINDKPVYYDDVNYFIKTATGVRLVIDYERQGNYEY